MDSAYQAVIDRLSSRITNELNILEGRLGSAWQVLAARPNASELTLNPQSTRLDAWFAPGVLSHWGGSIKATLIGSGLSTDSNDNNYSVTSLTVGLFEGTVSAARASNPLAQLSAQMTWVVEPDINGYGRTKVFSLQSLLMESGPLGLYVRGPLTLNPASNSVSSANSLIEIRLGKDPTGAPALRAQFEGSFALDLDHGTLSGTLSRLGLYDAQNQPISVQSVSLSFSSLAALEQQIETSLVTPLRSFIGIDVPDIVAEFESYFQAVALDLQLPNPAAVRTANSDGTEVRITYPLGSFGYTDGRVVSLVKGTGLSTDPNDSSFDISSLRIRFEPSNLREPNIVPEIEFQMRADISVRPSVSGAPDLKKFLLYEFTSNIEGLGVSLTAPAGIDYLNTSSREVAGTLEFRSALASSTNVADRLLLEGKFVVSPDFETIAGVANRISLIDQSGSVRYQRIVDQTFNSVGDLFSPTEVEKWLTEFVDAIIPERTASSTGRAYFWKGGYLMPEVTIELSGEVIGQTSATGTYGFSQLAMTTHRLHASKVISEYEQGGVINSADALAALKLAVGRNPNTDGSALSPYQLIAADVNNDGRVSSVDALAILKMAVKRADAPARQWVFVDERLDLWDELGQTFHATRNSVPASDGLIARFDPAVRSDVAVVGILKGDVNGSWRPAAPDVALPASYFSDLAVAFPTLIHPHQFGLSIA